MIKVRQDLTGLKVNYLTVLRQAEDHVAPSGRKSAMWLCKCELCGREKAIAQSTLKAGTIKSCGCQQSISLQKFNDSQKEKNDLEIIGQKFGKLTVLERDNVFKTVHYLCKCDCGNTISVLRKNLLNGKTVDCGCETPGRIYYEDLRRQKFGKLTPLYYTQSKNRKAYWMCQCDCGNQKEISAEALKRGNTMSCGCLKQSHGEFVIEQLLKTNNISYIKEYAAFKYENNSAARFDFYINNKYFIEFDGQQHFESRNHGWDTPELVESYKVKDEIKNKWCKENNIPLIRIPYTHLDEITIDDLLLEKSKFII